MVYHFLGEVTRFLAHTFDNNPAHIVSSHRLLCQKDGDVFLLLFQKFIRVNSAESLPLQDLMHLTRKCIQFVFSGKNLMMIGLFPVLVQSCRDVSSIVPVRQEFLRADVHNRTRRHCFGFLDIL